MRTLDQLLTDSPVFAGMRPDWLAYVAGCAHNVRFDEGRQLFRAGDEADTFYVVRSGEVAIDLYVPGRGEVVIETLHEGDVVGWSWLYPPYRWQFDGRAAEDTAAIEFHGACLREKCAEDSELGYELMRRFAQVMLERLHATQIRLLDVYGTVPVA